MQVQLGCGGLGSGVRGSVGGVFGGVSGEECASGHSAGM